MNEWVDEHCLKVWKVRYEKNIQVLFKIKSVFFTAGPAGQKDAFDLGGHWVCTRQTDIMELIQELGGIEYYPQNIEG